MLKTLLISSLMGGILSTDVLVAFQFMVSRPLVAAALTGACLGEPAHGCLRPLGLAGVVVHDQVEGALLAARQLDAASAIGDELEQLHCVIIDTVLKTPSMLAAAPVAPGSEPTGASNRWRLRRSKNKP